MNSLRPQDTERGEEGVILPRPLEQLDLRLAHQGESVEDALDRRHLPGELLLERLQDPLHRIHLLSLLPQRPLDQFSQ
ncbi:MAG: hypothetical protein HYY93_09320 [Planctomycetes bacterium]|nr:hypothetical protein [Planctomycetota bacterium]